jgi:response regulator RpfG family c-di-GMP phosphodiesterase
MPLAANAHRLTGRIMIVSDRAEVVAELEPILRAGEHIATTVPDGEEALRILGGGVVPDLVISDLGSAHSLEAMDYVWRFREVNRVGRHMVIVEAGAPSCRSAARTEGAPESITALRRPFGADEVQATVDSAIRRMDREIHARRGETWREIDRLHRAVRDVQRDVVAALAATIAARDPWMQGHASRVASLCRLVASVLRLSEENAAVLEDAARLHEIGKVGVPLELLHKTEPLSDQELERIRGHAAAGAAILREVPSLRRAALLVERHGTDYQELAAHVDCGTIDFLLVSVLRVVDAYDAMTHGRSYREAFPEGYSRSTLERGAGTAFHPGAVRALLRVLNPDAAATAG